jgi:hypothetical protein
MLVGYARVSTHDQKLELQVDATTLEALRQDIQRSAQELKALQPGIERSAGIGVRNAVAVGANELRRDAAYAALGWADRCRRPDAWNRVDVFLRGRRQRRIEEKIDQLLQAAPIATQPAAVVSPAPVTGSGHVHSKVHGSQAAVLKPKTQQEEPAPPVPDQP